MTNMNRDAVKKKLYYFIQKRRQSPTDNFDYLNLFLSDDKVFGDEGALDMVIDFFLAAVQTTNTALITAISYLMKNPEAFKKVRAEVDAYLKERLEEDPELRNLSKLDLLMKVINGETCFEFSYLNCVLMEALRFQPPIPTPNFNEALADCKIGKYNIKKGDSVTPWITGLHFNSSQWQRPEEFLPERFDYNHPLFLTPSGEKRHPNSFLAFSAGYRICIGKTLGEMNTRILAIIIT